MRLGDLDELLKKVTSEYDDFIGIADFLEIWESMPTVDAEPIRYGKWIRIDEFTIKCSMCNQGGIFASDWEYCPLCGARMEGE